MTHSRTLRTALPLLLVVGTGMVILGLLNGLAVSADSADPSELAPDAGLRAATSPLVSTVTELTPVADTWVDEDHPSTNNGGANSLVAGDGDHQWSLLRFDLSSLPDYFDVQTATLKMYTRVNLAADAAAAPLANELKADAITDDWDEMTLDWHGRPAWEHLLDPPTTFVVDGWTVWDVTNIVQSWGDGNLPNNGIRIRSDSVGFSYAWWSRETTGPPILTIAYTEAPPPCNPVASVDVSGATSGVTGANYTFSASTSPADADPPDSISWQVTDYAQRFYGESVSVSWATAGEKTVNVVVAHCGGTTSSSHTVNISDPPPGCAQPVTGTSISGPILIDTGASHTFQSASVPYNATDPVTFTWDVIGQSPVVDVTDTNLSTQDYAWSTAGDLRVWVTAENCGGSAVAYHYVRAVDPADLPDLLVSSAWNDKENGRIGYVMHNDGDSIVPAGFLVAAERGSSTPAVDPYPNTLGPGDVGLGYIDWEWGCTGVTETIGVPADWGEDVVELDELNNRWSDVWACDQQPPAITSGPQVTFVSETRARIEWDTDEDCQGWVEYGTSQYNQSATAPGSGLYATSHAVTVNNLNAGTTYYAGAFCTDAAGLTVNSAPLQFETAPPGSDPPVIRSISTSQYPSDKYEYWQVDVEMENDDYMDRVACYFDGVLLGIDYSADASGDYPVYSFYLSPYALGQTRAGFFGASHEVSCTAFRQAPDAFTTLDETVTISGETDPPLRLFIDEPYPNQKLYIAQFDVPDGTTLDVTVLAAAYEWACTHSGFSEGDVVAPGLDPVDCDDLTPLPADQVQLFIDGAPNVTEIPGPSEQYLTLTADIGGLDQGDHEIRTVAAKGTNATEVSRNLVVEFGDAGLEVTRSIRPEGNTLEVTLDLHNAGTIDANLMRIVDHVIGLQPILKRDESLGFPYQVGIHDIEPLFDGSGARHLHVGITFPITQTGTVKQYLILEPGESVRLEYVVVPELHAAARPPLIGTLWDPTEVVLHDEHYGYAYQTFDLRETLVNDPQQGMLSLEDAVANAIGQSDYVIVTIPDRVYGMLTDSTLLIPDEDAELLFSNMAELASLENGVLGYLNYYDTHPLDDLLEPGYGSWADKMAPVFSEKDKGYVLLVGETEIVPSFYIGESHFATYPGIPDHVHESDIQYAHTAGSTARPELVVGRVIGNNLDVLNTYLENMIHAARGDPGYGFSRSSAYISNGNGDGEDWFQVDAFAVDVILDLALDQSIWISFVGDDGAAQRSHHLTNMPNKDIILYRGHGNEDDWDDGFLAGDVNAGVYDFGNTNPAMMAAACETGNYEVDSDLNLSELVLEYGAGVYSGATEKSERWSNSDAFINFAVNWLPSLSMGQALNVTKREVWDMDWLFDNRKLWACETNLYGDPKYGRAPDALASSAQAAEAETLSVTAAPDGLKLKVSLPELTVSQIDGGDVPRITGGWTLAELGAYPVPAWTFSLDFPAGQIVQDVELISRGTPVVTTSLGLPVVQAASDCDCAAKDAAAPTQATVTGWYPAHDQTLEWSLEKHADGASTLQVVLYPFTYHADSGDALYYRWYTLDVHTINTAVRLQSLQVPSTGAVPRDLVPLSLIISKDGRPQDVIVQPSVRRLGTGEVLGGLPLMTLHDLEGTATVDLTWDTRPYRAGDYMIVVELLSSSGRLLDTASAEVRLGIPGAKLRGLIASRETFAPGEPITLTMGLVNTGTVTLDGTAVFVVHESDTLSAMQTLTVPVSALRPGQTTNLSAVWDSTGTLKPGYRVLGYFKYHSRTTEPLALTLYRPRIYLPLAIVQ